MRKETPTYQADGLAMRMLAEPDRDWSGAIEASVASARPLLDA